MDNEKNTSKKTPEDVIASHFKEKLEQDVVRNKELDNPLPVDVDLNQKNSDDPPIAEEC